MMGNHMSKIIIILLFVFTFSIFNIYLLTKFVSCHNTDSNSHSRTLRNCSSPNHKHLLNTGPQTSLWSLATLSDSFNRNVLWQPRTNPIAASAFASQLVFRCLSVAVRRKEVERGTWPARMWNLKHFLITGQPVFTPQTSRDIRGGRLYKSECSQSQPVSKQQP